MAEAIFLAEYNSISYGIAVLDRLVKRSAVEVVCARPLCAGKFLIVLGGDVDDVDESRAEVEALGPERRINTFLLTNAHRDILDYFRRSDEVGEDILGARAVGTFEAHTVSDALHGLDAALKSGSVRLGRLWLGQFLGGKTCFLLVGQVADVEAAIAAARACVDDKHFVDSQVIPSPGEETIRLLLEQGAL